MGYDNIASIWVNELLLTHGIAARHAQIQQAQASLTPVDVDITPPPLSAIPLWSDPAAAVVVPPPSVNLNLDASRASLETAEEKEKS